MSDNWIAAVVFLAGLIALAGLFRGLQASIRSNRDAMAKYGDYLEVVREGQRLQIESNSLLRDLIAALREKR